MNDLFSIDLKMLCAWHSIYCQLLCHTLYKKLIKTFGESEEQININNSWAKRNKAQKEKDPSKEYAYVWTKKEKNNDAEVILIESEEIDYENFECFTEA